MKILNENSSKKAPAWTGHVSATSICITFHSTEDQAEIIAKELKNLKLKITERKRTNYMP